MVCILSGVILAEGTRTIERGGTGEVVVGVVIFCVGFLFRFAVWKEGNAERLTRERFAMLAWGCICWMLAGLIPQILCSPWIWRPGKLTTAQYVIAFSTGAGAFLVAHFLGWAIRNPKTTMKVVGWGAVVVTGAALASWGISAIFEALTVKALLAIIVVLLLLQGGRRS
ncbi:hypothetical protein BO221_50430 [Archangium sp. Cb G35]|nr:hypothetical protein BO221_50430 [Archangium sp. Cb G35]